MRSLLSVLIIVLAVSTVCYSNNECGRYKINGDSTFPWNVGIYLGNQNQAELVCFGSIIQSNAVLAAAHCFCDNLGGNLRNESFYLVTGNLPKKINLKTPPSTLHKVTNNSINTHKHYKGVTNAFENDLAIVKDKFSFSDRVQPVCVDWSSDISDSNSEAKEPIWHDNKVKNVEQTYLEFEDSDDIPKDFLAFVTDDKSCIKLKTSGVRLSRESEGGGLVFENSDRWYIKGVISMHDVTNGQLSTYTSVRQYINWISNICA